VTIQRGTKFYSIQFGGEIIGRTELVWYNQYVNPITRNNSNNDDQDYLFMLIKLGILSTEDKVRGRICLNIRAEGYNTLMDIGDKVQNYPYFDSDVDPKVEEDMEIYCKIRGLMMLQEQLKIFRWCRLADLNLIKQRRIIREKYKLIIVTKSEINEAMKNMVERIREILDEKVCNAAKEIVEREK
jgi:hypothetical protein